ncbi:MAG: TIGR02281 family clan AA aspartic protease [Phenylobacterium sp.]|uniref:TIGR02281 family clan AA aspartic protease n=1 Tax=Phenylobacterium sp. TaxID=1871053 RepID=UPI00391B6028
MLRFTALAVTAAVSAYAAAKAVVTLDDKASQPQMRAAVAQIEPTAASVAKAGDGHYWAEADVDGKAVRFLVDTGASAVALTPHDAERLGIDTQALDYAYRVTTASGQTRAAAVRLASISIAGARVTNVDALVIEDGLQTSLLGMTYLGRLSRFEATPTTLILRP